MNETEFSKSPWTRESSNGSDKILSADGEVIMCDMQYYPYVTNIEANWFLIESAPDLYSALEELLKARWTCSVDWAATDKANAALAKARGER